MSHVEYQGIRPIYPRKTLQGKGIFKLLIWIVFFTSCQETIEVDLPPQQERLVIDALMRIPDEAAPMATAYLRITKTAPYFSDRIPTVDDARVSLFFDSNNYTLNNQGNGYYASNVPREELTGQLALLEVEYEGQFYKSSAHFEPAVPLDSLYQGDGSLFSGSETEVVIAYTDPPGEPNFYLFDLDKGQFLTSDDVFYQGQAFSFSYFYESLEPNDTIEIDLMGIDKTFFDYMNIVINQSGQATGNPFTAPPAQVRGNIVNATNEADYPLGYFAIAQVYTRQLIIE